MPKPEQQTSPFQNTASPAPMQLPQGAAPTPLTPKRGPSQPGPSTMPMKKGMDPQQAAIQKLLMGGGL